MGKVINRVKEGIAVYSVDLYPTCLSFLAMAEERVYINNTKSLCGLPVLRKTFLDCA